MKAALVAMELRKLADALDVQPDAEIVKPYVWFMANDKDAFLALARLLPRPLVKKLDGPYIQIGYDNPAIFVASQVSQSLTCELIEPAKPAVYRCDPILSEEEDAAVIA